MLWMWKLEQLSDGRLEKQIGKWNHEESIGLNKLFDTRQNIIIHPIFMAALIS